jgi:addiction module HigA family antidote
MRREMIEALHPGCTIKEDVLPSLGMTVNKLAAALGMHASRLNEIVLRRRGITADTALRLARYLGTSPEFWLNLQSIYDLRLAQYKNMRAIKKQVRPRAVA